MTKQKPKKGTPASELPKPAEEKAVETKEGKAYGDPYISVDF